MIQRSQQFDKVNTVGVTNIFFLLNFWLESAVWEKEKMGHAGQSWKED